MAVLHGVLYGCSTRTGSARFDLATHWPRLQKGEQSKMEWKTIAAVLAFDSLRVSHVHACADAQRKRALECRAGRGRRSAVPGGGPVREAPDEHRLLRSRQGRLGDVQRGMEHEHAASHYRRTRHVMARPCTMRPSSGNQRSLLSTRWAFASVECWRRSLVSVWIGSVAIDDVTNHSRFKFAFSTLCSKTRRQCDARAWPPCGREESTQSAQRICCFAVFARRCHAVTTRDGHARHVRFSRESRLSRVFGHRKVCSIIQAFNLTQQNEARQFQSVDFHTLTVCH